MSVACIVIASQKRQGLLDAAILPSILPQWFNEVVVVGDYHSGDGYRHLPFAPVTGTTTDALFKRDVGLAATKSDFLCYLCDDHRLHPDFARDLQSILSGCKQRDVVVPARYCVADGVRVPLNMGAPDYVGGHAGIFPRDLLRQVPWSVAPWHPNWDVLHSRMLLQHGAHLHFQQDRLYIEDIEGGTPWR